MLASVTTFAIDGLLPQRITVEVDQRLGLPAFTIVGRGDASVRESRERVQVALRNSGFEMPARRITVNLAPAHMRKVGPGFDLATACGVLAASEQVPVAPLTHWAVFGELSLSGELRHCRGALAVAQGARRTGMPGLIVPRECLREAALVDGLEVVGAGTLAEVAAILRGAARGSTADDLPPERGSVPAPPPDLCDVRGHQHAIFALTVAAAGRHNVLLSGPPGVGKTMLARRLPGLLPPMSRDEAIDVTRIHSVAGAVTGGLVAERPFRAPHHTISASGLVGGGSGPRPGEVSLAHLGVLYLDELSEFSRSALEALRQPLEDGFVTIVRGQRMCVFPAGLQLVASTNPCPCGHGGTDRCSCGEADHARHARRLSGPLIDRFDMVLDLDRPKTEAFDLDAAVTTSAEIASQVAAAWERRAARKAEGPACVSDMHRDARQALRDTYARGEMSARGRARVLRVARTIADLRSSDRIDEEHVRKALTLRRRESKDTATGQEAA